MSLSPESLVEKTVVVKLDTRDPIPVIDDQGEFVGSARLEGNVGLTLIINKHHPAALDIETENGLAKLKLVATINDNFVVDGTLSVGTVQ